MQKKSVVNTRTPHGAVILCFFIVLFVAGCGGGGGSAGPAPVVTTTDTTAPVKQSQSMPDGVTDLDYNTLIGASVVYDENLAPANAVSGSTSTVTITTGGNPVLPTPTVTVSGQSLSFQHVAYETPGTSYTATFLAQDVAGNQAVPVVIHYATKVAPADPSASLALVSAVPSAGAINVAQSTNSIVLNMSEAVKTASVNFSTVKMTCGTGSDNYPLTFAVSPDMKTVTATFSKALVLGDVCKVAINGIKDLATASSALTTSYQWIVSLVSMPSSWWPPQTIAPIGTKVYMSPLRNNAVTIGDAIWQQAITDGTAKVIDSGMVLPNGPVDFVFYTSLNGFSCTMPVYKSDGSWVGNNIPEGGSCYTGALSDWALGTPTGAIDHDPSTSLCWKWTFDPSTMMIVSSQTACP